MKKAILLLAALLCSVCLLTSTACAAQAESAGEDASAAEVSEDVKADGINLAATTTLIIVICSVLTGGVVTFAVVLGRRNQGPPADAE